MESDHTTVQTHSNPTLSEIASAFETQTIRCSACQGSGEREYETVRVTNLCAPFAHHSGPCDVCRGNGELTVEVCPLCLQTETGCRCEATVCCRQHPVNCECEYGVLFYQMAYGLPKREERLAA
jgi:hypothetical protein